MTNAKNCFLEEADEFSPRKAKILHLAHLLKPATAARSRLAFSFS